MLNFSIMPLDERHVDEICRDIIYQVKSGIATMPLFKVTLTPEGVPAIDKADICCRIYEKYKQVLDKEGIPSGILIQASIGHGWKLNQPSAFQKYTGLLSGAQSEVCCPMDKGFWEYIRNSAARIAKAAPSHIMLDDDFRLMARPDHGCACPLHLKKLSELLGYELTREQITEKLDSNSTEEEKRVRDAFIKTQIDSLIDCAKEIRKGIDSVDGTIPGSFCLCGDSAEGAYEIAKIMAGEGNTVVLRVNNGNYCKENPRTFVYSLYSASTQIEALSGKPDVILAETDTCPQNRYSTPAVKLHSHFTFTILEGASGAKHWITRLAAYEPQSGMAYRKKLETYCNFYHELCNIVPHLTWLGCKTPVPNKPQYVLGANDASKYNSLGWCTHVLDRFGLPMHFSNSSEGTCFFDGKRDKFFTDNELLDFLSGKIVLDAAAAKEFIKRGFGKYIGVDVKSREATAKTASSEFYYPEGNSNAQYDVHELIPLSDDVKSYSDVYHLYDGVNYEYLFPAVTSYKNELGGVAVVFSGITNFPFSISKAFGFLTETRKKQLIRILEDMDSLPIYYPDDAEMFLKAARTDDGKLFCAVLDMSLDAVEQLPLVCQKPIKNIKRLTADGEYEEVGFYCDGENTILNLTAYPFEPVILIIETK